MFSSVHINRFKAMKTGHLDNQDNIIVGPKEQTYFILICVVKSFRKTALSTYKDIQGPSLPFPA